MQKQEIRRLKAACCGASRAESHFRGLLVAAIALEVRHLRGEIDSGGPSRNPLVPCTSALTPTLFALPLSLSLWARSLPLSRSLPYSLLVCQASRLNEDNTRECTDSFPRC